MTISRRPIKNCAIGRELLQAVLLIALSLLTVRSFAEPPAPKFTLTDLGRLQHISDDIAPGLGANGSIAAWAPKPNGGFAGTYQSSLTAVPVAVSQPGKDLFAADVTADGVVVGLAKDPRDLRFTQAFVWRQGAITLLPTLGGAYASAHAVSASGRIVGLSDLSDGLHHACLWQGGVAHDLGTLPGGDFSAAAGLNVRGEIVGVSNVAANGKGHAALWRQGQVQDLGLLPDGSVSAARAINAKGDAVGWADIYGGAIHAVLWHAGHPLDIGTLGDDPGSAWSINDAGQIVGSSAISSGKMHAFFWQQGHMLDLNDLIPAHSGWILETACRISNRGWILGLGRLKGDAHLFLLRPVAAGGMTAKNAK